MAQDDSTRATNGSGGGASEPQASTLAQYIKDLSVESPAAPQVFQWQEQPSVDVSFNLNVDKKAEDIHEVMLKLEIRAHSANGVHFLVDLSYGGIFGLRNFPEEALAPFLLIEAPRLLFPFARQIITDSIQNMGFPPLMLDPIDFAAAYVAQVQAAQGQQGQQGQQAAEPEAGDKEKAESPAGEGKGEG